MSEENGLEAFRSLGLSGATLAALEKKGFSEPTEIQKACIPLLLDGQKDVIGQAQTGTGKTAAFGLPIIELLDTEDSSTQALVLTPTRELAMQVAKEIASLRGEKRISVGPSTAARATKASCARSARASRLSWVHRAASRTTSRGARWTSAS